MVTISVYALLGEHKNEDYFFYCSQLYCSQLSEMPVRIMNRTMPIQIRLLFMKQTVNKLISLAAFLCSKTCLKRPLKNRQNKGLKDKW